MKYGYARVSTIAQKTDRQIGALRKHGVLKKNIFVDKVSGKNFDRDNYRKLLETLREGDVLFVKSIDRLGRNYREIIEEWRVLTKVINCDVVVLDMPLLDTRTEKNLLGTFISDIVLQILSFVAENERAYILERQREGIAYAKRRGVKFGRPRKRLPHNFVDVACQWKAGIYKCVDAAALLKMPTSTFRRRALEVIKKLQEDK